jgi:hypothetical protein
MKTLQQTKDAIVCAIGERSGGPVCFKDLVRAVRDIDSQFSYYSWIYGVALKELEAEGKVIVERDKKRNGRLSVRASW